MASPLRSVMKIGIKSQSSPISRIGFLNHSVSSILTLALRTDDLPSVGFSPADGSEAAPRHSGRKTEKPPEIELEMDGDGYPLLPSWEDVQVMRLQHKKSLLAKFMGEMYGTSAASFYYFSVLTTLQNFQLAAETRKSHGGS